MVKNNIEVDVKVKCIENGVNVNYNLKNFRNYSLIKIGILNEEKSELYF